MGASLMFFGQTIGGAIFISVAQNIFSNELVRDLAGLTGFDSAQVVNVGATNLRTVIPPQYLPEVLTIYNRALANTWYTSTALVCCSFVAALFMEWKTVKKGKTGPKKGAEEKV